MNIDTTKVATAAGWKVLGKTWRKWEEKKGHLKPSGEFQSRTCSEAGALKLDFAARSPRNWISYIKVSTTSDKCPCKAPSMETAWDRPTLDWGWSPGKSVPVKGIIWFAAKFPSPWSQVLQSEIKIKRAVSTLLQAAYQQRGDIPETHYIQYTWKMWK